MQKCIHFDGLINITKIFRQQRLGDNRYKKCIFDNLLAMHSNFFFFFFSLYAYISQSFHFYLSFLPASLLTLFHPLYLSSIPSLLLFLLLYPISPPLFFNLILFFSFHSLLTLFISHAFSLSLNLFCICHRLFFFSVSFTYLLSFFFSMSKQ